MVEILKLSWSLSFVEMFCCDFLVDVWTRFRRWNLIKICVGTCDMNSILGSVVPLAMFDFSMSPIVYSSIWRASLEEGFIWKSCLVLILSFFVLPLLHPSSRSGVFRFFVSTNREFLLNKLVLLQDFQLSVGNKAFMAGIRNKLIFLHF